LGDATSYCPFGNGTYTVTNLPEQIVASNVTEIAAGGWDSLFLKSDGTLWAMGINGFGELGDGTYNCTNRPEQISATNVIAIATQGYHSLFLKNDGTLWGMGQNGNGQLGDGSNNDTNRPEQIAVGPPGYNRISAQLLTGGNQRLSFVGNAGANYALDRSFSVVPANWVPQATNPAGSDGVLLFTNMLNALTNNFWRIRSVRQ
jgi:hypothetical protein